MENNLENSLEKIKIYILDDHPIVLKGLSHYLHESDRFIVSGFAHETETAFQQISNLHPDVVIVDIELKTLTGFDVTTWIVEHHSNIKVLVFSIHNEDSFIERALRAGASGYVIKDEPIDNLLRAIETIMQNKIYINDAAKDRLLLKLLDHKLDTSFDPVRQLTNREFEVFQKIGEGHSIKEIAKTLQLSVKTIQTYRERIKEKLHITMANDLVHYAHEWVALHK